MTRNPRETDDGTGGRRLEHTTLPRTTRTDPEPRFNPSLRGILTAGPVGERPESGDDVETEESEVQKDAGHERGGRGGETIERDGGELPRLASVSLRTNHPNPPIPDPQTTQTPTVKKCETKKESDYSDY